MPEISDRVSASGRRIRYRGRLFQIPIYLGKLLRSFVYQSDWKVLPMTAAIAALVSMVIRRDFFVTMEGGLKGSFALACVAIWNGCFNSIQSICRERGIVKREHRSGMHVSAYVSSHMIYQALLCLAQSALSVYVCKVCGVKFPSEGLITPFLIVDIAITIFLASYASDMISLFVSGITHTTTAAMTVMPFLLIFQLIFSGGMLTLPDWAKPLSNYTISNYTIRAIAAQSDYNNKPSVLGWNTLLGLRDDEVNVSMTVGELLDSAANNDSPAASKLRDVEIGGSMTVGQARQIAEGLPAVRQMLDGEFMSGLTVKDLLNTVLEEEAFRPMREFKLLPRETGMGTLGDLVRLVLNSEGMQERLDAPLAETLTLREVLTKLKVFYTLDSVADKQLSWKTTAGALLDQVTENTWVQDHRDQAINLNFKVGDLFDLVGEEKLKALVQEKTARVAFKEEYVMSKENIYRNWLHICAFTVLFAALTVLALEFIDKDKR